MDYTSCIRKEVSFLLYSHRLAHFIDPQYEINLTRSPKTENMVHRAIILSLRVGQILFASIALGVCVYPIGWIGKYTFDISDLLIYFLMFASLFSLVSVHFIEGATHIHFFDRITHPNIPSRFKV